MAISLSKTEVPGKVYRLLLRTSTRQCVSRDGRTERGKGELLSERSHSCLDPALASATRTTKIGHWNLRKLNWLLRQVQQSCSRLLIIHCRRVPCVVTYSDAAWAVRREGESQEGYLTCPAYAEHLSFLSWHSGRCRRIARSSLSAAARAAGEAQAVGDHVRLVIVDLLFQDANIWNANEQIALLPGTLVLD